MKKVILGLVIILIVGMATAQEKESFGFTKNDVFLGGSLSGFNTKDNDDFRNSYLFCYPTIAYFIKNNFAVGINIPLGYGKEENDRIGRIEKDYIYGVDAFGRYYFLEFGKRFKIYNQLNFGYRRVNSKYEYNPGYGRIAEIPTPDETHSQRYNTNIGLGLNFFVTKNIILKAYLGQLIEYTYIKDEEDNSRKEFDLNLNSHGATFGIAYKF